MLFKRKLTWRRPLFYILLPVFLVMVFLGFPLPVAPPPETKARQEESVLEKKKKKCIRSPADLADGDDGPRQAAPAAQGLSLADRAAAGQHGKADAIDRSDAGSEHVETS